MGPTL
jgi:hypothetical protein